MLFPAVFGLVVLAVAAVTYFFLASDEGSAPVRPAPPEATGDAEPPFRLPAPEPAPTPTPEDPRALLAEGNAAAREKRWKEALVLYERAQALSPRDRQIEEALKDARRALSDQELLRRSAEALALRREWDTRLQGLRGSLKRAEDGGDVSAARTYARQILDMVPNDLPARAFQERDLVETRARADQAVLDLDEGGIRRLWEEYSNSWPGDLRAATELTRSLRRLERARNILAKASPPSATP